MGTLFRIGQTLKGRVASYTISKQVQDTVWFARNQLAHETVVIKGVEGHPRVENERDVLKKLQGRTLFLRPLVDEIEEPSTPTTIVLKHLDSDLLTETIKKRLTRKELKHVCRNILEALELLHEHNLVHTDIKLDNIFVNLQEDENDRFSAVQLGDFGGCYPADSKWATSGTRVGTPMWSAPELLLEMPWNTSVDIWSFGTVLISLIYGGDFNLFRPPHVRRDDDEYALGVLMEMYRYFAPFPPSIVDIASDETCAVLAWITQQIPNEQLNPFEWITREEVSKRDNDFLMKIMKFDYRDRPSAKQLLADKWWEEEHEDVPPRIET
ncbi:kinase-like domain-containing protein [Ampelomyces quisqualis]|uniref:Kinase-like domain-containing protein n=1 Tax=Ampelomyces quisqualis TaxID=50730 RepID=A0A6A5QGD8_AMPQU|nr:kinase-like domain-containing protein [Ampelomyces quisqualis]